MNRPSQILFDLDPMHAWVVEIYRAFCRSPDMAGHPIALTTYHSYSLVSDAEWMSDPAQYPKGVVTDRKEVWRRCLREGIPSVLLNHVLERRLRAGECVVRSDHRAMGALAAEALVSRGIAHVGFLGCRSPERSAMDLKEEGFDAALRRLNFRGERLTLPVLPYDQRWPTPDAVMHLAEWLRSAPRSLGLAAVNIFFAWGAWNAAKLAKRVLPDDMLLLAVGNDPVLLEMASPSISGIQENSAAIGQACAREMAALLAGEALSRETLVPPSMVIHRQSTAYIQSDDPVILRAQQYMRDTLAEKPSVEEIARQAFVSRATLLRRFHEQLGRSPSQELARLRLEKAIDLILHSREGFAAIADQAGYGLQSALSRAIREATGKSPTQLRRDTQA